MCIHLWLKGLQKRERFGDTILRKKESKQKETIKKSQVIHKLKYVTFWLSKSLHSCFNKAHDR